MTPTSADGHAERRRRVSDTLVLRAVILIHFDTITGPVIAVRYPDGPSASNSQIDALFARLSGLFVDNDQRRAFEGSELGYLVECHSRLALLHRAVELSGDHYARNHLRFTPAFVFAMPPGEGPSLDAVDQQLSSWGVALETLVQYLIMKENASGAVVSAIAAESEHRSVLGKKVSSFHCSVPPPQQPDGEMHQSTADASVPGRPCPDLDSACLNKFDEADPLLSLLFHRYAQRTTVEAAPERAATPFCIHELLGEVYNTCARGKQHLELPTGALLPLAATRRIRPRRGAGVHRSISESARWPFGHPSDDNAVPSRRAAAQALLADVWASVDIVAYDILAAVDGSSSIKALAHQMVISIDHAREAIAQFYAAGIVDVAPPLPTSIDCVLNDYKVTTPALCSLSRAASAEFPVDAHTAEEAESIPGLRTCMDFYASVVADTTGNVYSSLGHLVHSLLAGPDEASSERYCFSARQTGSTTLPPPPLASSGGIQENSIPSDSFEESHPAVSRSELPVGSYTASGEMPPLGATHGAPVVHTDDFASAAAAQSILWDILPLFDEEPTGSAETILEWVRAALVRVKGIASSAPLDIDASLHTRCVVERLASRALPEALEIFVKHARKLLLFVGTKGWLVSRFAD